MNEKKNQNEQINWKFGIEKYTFYYFYLIRVFVNALNWYEMLRSIYIMSSLSNV